MQRRTFLYNLGGMLSYTLVSSYTGRSVCPAQANAAIEPAIPIIMFHKVTERPKYPEEIRSDQLRQLFTHIFTLGYRPVNMSDILNGKVDRVVAKGYKPLGITADDSHPSILFSRHTANLDYVQNDESFVDILAECAQSFHCDARATLFLSRQVDDRLFKTPTDYFGGVRPLKDIIETLGKTTPSPSHVGL